MKALPPRRSLDSMAVSGTHETTLDEGPVDLRTYFVRSRRVSLSLVYVAALFVTYEIAYRCVDPGVQNAAAHVFDRIFWMLGPEAIWLNAFLGLVFAYAVVRVIRDRQPVGRLFVPFLVECVLLALLLGPIVNMLTGTFALQTETVPPHGGQVSLVSSILASLGAGIYEELLFRAGILGGIYVALKRILRARRGQRAVAFSVALILSALAFAAYHHIGPGGEPFDRRAFTFRALAGILLGLVFACRGLGVVVYLHAMYDVLYDLRVAAWSWD